jgi:hypothetical protein
MDGKVSEWNGKVMVHLKTVSYFISIVPNLVIYIIITTFLQRCFPCCLGCLLCWKFFSRWGSHMTPRLKFRGHLRVLNIWHSTLFGASLTSRIYFLAPHSTSLTANSWLPFTSHNANPQTLFQLCNLTCMKLPLHQQFQALPDSPWEFVFLGLDYWHLLQVWFRYQDPIKLEWTCLRGYHTGVYLTMGTQNAEI